MELWYTLGESSLGKEIEILEAGATGVRLTFSYGNPQLQEERARNVKSAAKKLGRPCRVIADLAGGKIRLGIFQGKSTISVGAGEIVRFVRNNPEEKSGDIVLPVPNKSFYSQVTIGDKVVIGDGGAVFEVNAVAEGLVQAKSVRNGTIDQCRGVIIQGDRFEPQTLSEKDLADLEHILASSLFDIVALSFVGSDGPVRKVRELAKLSNQEIEIAAKIETATGLENIESICQAADIIIAARGDLAFSIPWVELSAAVEKIALTAKSCSTPWIVATQVAEGVARYGIPSRAEICDLAHWLNQGCQGCLLSYETAFGSEPIASVQQCANILNRWSNFA